MDTSMCSQAASHASTLATPASSKDSPMTPARRLAAACGLSSPVLLARFDPDTFWPKTYQASLFQEHSDAYSQTWPESGMWDAGEVYELQSSAPATCESASSSAPTWPTVRASSGGGNRSAYEGAPYRPAIAQRATEAMEIWQTPAVDSFRSRGGDRKDEMGLDQQARFFPTPTARDHRSPNLHPDQLPNFIAHSWPTPNANPSAPNNSTKREGGRVAQRLTDQCLETRALASLDTHQAPLIQDGPISSESDLTSRLLWPTPIRNDGEKRGDFDAAKSPGLAADAKLWPTPRREPGTHSVVDGKRYETSLEYVARDQADETRRLSPRFVEWLQAFPIGWTELDPEGGPMQDRARRLSCLGNAVFPPCAEFMGRVIVKFEEEQNKDE